jgi:hypothetical protein
MHQDAHLGQAGVGLQKPEGLKAVHARLADGEQGRVER